MIVTALPRHAEKSDITTSRFAATDKSCRVNRDPIDKSLLLLFFRKEESSFLKERSKELL
jgi:hypothetical protein